MDNDSDDEPILPVRKPGLADALGKAFLKPKAPAKTVAKRGTASPAVRGKNSGSAKKPGMLISANAPAGYPTRKAVALKAEKGANKWWAHIDMDKIVAIQREDVRWVSLVHNGVCFPAPYKPHGKPVKINGSKVPLTPEQEEPATWYAGVLHMEHVKKPVFNANFFSCWKELFPKDHPVRKAIFSQIDFGPIREWLDKQKEVKAARDKEEKAEEKAQREKVKSIYGVALIDGMLQKISNFNIEPPGLFRGRGNHPSTGKFKARIMPEQVILNLSEGVPIPECPVKGHNWGGIVHDPTVTWLAYWRDNLGNTKYVMLDASSKFKGENDIAKYNRARLLKSRIEKIRADYRAQMASNVVKQRQIGTAVYLIDRLALRVGGEKNTAEEADTVGCTSLRVEHLRFKGSNTVEFDFLGKDSIRYNNTVELDSLAYRNLQDFCKGKKPDDDIFHQVNPAILNEHLTSLMPGLTAKVFRTFNASNTLQVQFYEKMKPLASTEPNVQKRYYDQANREVAVLCNHQRTKTASFETTTEKMELTTAFVKLKHTLLVALKKQDHATVDARLTKELKALNKKLKSLGAKEVSYKLPNLSGDKLKAAIERARTALVNQEAKSESRKETCEVALGTSKINYIDPRITVAWCKRNDVPIEKIFNKALLSKFPWAMEVDASWRF